MIPLLETKYKSNLLLQAFSSFFLNHCPAVTNSRWYFCTFLINSVLKTDLRVK